MQTFRNNTVTVTPGFLINLAAAVLLLPANWVAAWLLAAAFHELCHYIALRLCGVNVFAMRIGFSGAAIEAESMKPEHELIAALAGPFGGLLLLLLLRIMPSVAVSALIQSVFNLLPVYPLDGGRAIRALVACLHTKNSLQTNESNSTIANNNKRREGYTYDRIAAANSAYSPKTRQIHRR